MLRRACALAVIGTIFVCSAARALTFTSFASSDATMVLVLSGDIAEGDSDAFEKLIKSINDEGRLVSVVQLNSPGGSLAESVKLVDVVRRARLATAVTEGSICTSACFLIFAAGTDKYVSYSAQIGVHVAYDQSGQETIQSSAATLSMARLLKELGVPASIIGKMVVTGPQEIVWLTPGELSLMGATMTRKRAQQSVERRIVSQLPGSEPAPLEPLPLVTGAMPTDSGHWSKSYISASVDANRGDYTEAIRKWLLLAKENDAAAEFSLGQVYNTGEGATLNYVEAGKWYDRAAEQGLPEAQQNLGVAYALGRGVPQDYVLAYMWLNLAGASYTTEKDRALVVHERDLVSARMNSSQLAQGQQMSRDRMGRQEGSKP
jgi:hypothetical protein